MFNSALKLQILIGLHSRAVAQMISNSNVTNPVHSAAAASLTVKKSKISKEKHIGPTTFSSISSEP